MFFFFGLNKLDQRNVSALADSLGLKIVINELPPSALSTEDKVVHDCSPMRGEVPQEVEKSLHSFIEKAEYICFTRKFPNYIYYAMLSEKIPFSMLTSSSLKETKIAKMCLSRVRKVCATFGVSFSPSLGGKEDV